MRLEQTAVIVAENDDEWQAVRAHVEGHYGPGSVNEGLIDYTLDDATTRATLTRTIEEYAV